MAKYLKLWTVTEPCIYDGGNSEAVTQNSDDAYHTDIDEDHVDENSTIGWQTR